MSARSCETCRYSELVGPGHGYSGYCLATRPAQPLYDLVPCVHWRANPVDFAKRIAAWQRPIQEWRPIETAPGLDAVLVHVSGHPPFLAFQTALDEEYSWVSEGTAPADWVGGLCWRYRVNGGPSTPPDACLPLAGSE